jgi:hypothetical protein
MPNGAKEHGEVPLKNSGARVEAASLQGGGIEIIQLLTLGLSNEQADGQIAAWSCQARTIRWRVSHLWLVRRFSFSFDAQLLARVVTPKMESAESVPPFVAGKLIRRVTEALQ